MHNEVTVNNVTFSHSTEATALKIYKITLNEILLDFFIKLIGV